jgi:short-subunit dehydrogenase
MDPGYVALKIFNALMKKRRRVIIDYRFGIITFFWKLIPQAIWERIDIGHR